MCHQSCIIFGARNLGVREVRGRSVLEVGSRNVNGSLRPIIESWNPSRYVGVDVQAGRGVDIVCDVGDLVDKFGHDSFDVVIATEMIEHVKEWRTAISNIKAVCRPYGVIIMTTRSLGYGYHAFPYDFWRFDKGDMKKIFSDFELLVLEVDSQAPGVLLKARKPNNFVETDLSGHQLYSVVLKKKVIGVRDGDFENLAFVFLTVKERLKNLIFRIASLVLKHSYPDQYFR